MVVALEDHFVSFGVDGKFASAADMPGNEFPQRWIKDLTCAYSLIPIGMTTGLQPAIEFSMMNQQNLLAIGAYNPG